MAKFVTRVRLQDAVKNDFEKLDIEMGRASFTRIKKEPAGGPKYIPAACEYYRRGSNLTLQDVTDAVYRAAKNTGKKYSFTIIRERGVFPT
jgi:hypothetical protein